MGSILDKKTVTISLNNEKLDTLEIPTEIIGLQIEKLTIRPGVNVITLDTDEFTLVSDGRDVTHAAMTVSFRVESISIRN